MIAIAIIGSVFLICSFLLIIYFSELKREKDVQKEYMKQYEMALEKTSQMPIYLLTKDLESITHQVPKKDPVFEFVEKIEKGKKNIN